MAKLYDIADRYRNILNLIENEDFDGVDLQFALNQINDEFEVKADNIVYLIRETQADIEAIKNEEQRLSRRRKTLENSTQSIKEYLEQMMRLANKTKFKTTLNSFAIQKTKGSVVITDEALIPETYKEYEQVCKIDKNGLYNALKAGEEVQGVEIKENETLRIR